MQKSWLIENRNITYTDWMDFYQRYCSELEIEAEPMDVWAESQVFQNHPTFRGKSENWARLMPVGSVNKLNSTENAYEKFKQIVRETTENAIPNVERNRNDLATVADFVSSRYRGSVNFQSLIDGEIDNAEKTGTPYDGMSVLIRAVNERNYEDWYVYTVDDGQGLFGSDMGTQTHVAYQIYNSDIAPDQIIRNVAFELGRVTGERQSVPSVDPENNPVAITIDKNYYKVENPSRLFGDDWGEVDKMESILEQSSHDRNSIIGRDSWEIITGAPV